VTLQVGLVPLHDPPHPANTEVASGVAVKVIVDPWATSPTVQSEKQVKNAGAVTLPLPGPPKNIESVAGTNVVPPGRGLSPFGGLPSSGGDADLLPTLSGGLSSVPVHGGQ
jgi:hypothetical protein